ncbi:TMEM164 family acyltransferase [Mycoplasmopsis primatum]|uniref:TMEM164 family acyltransferase n=1 Tax=Mycoplasmopsis primatum TaxID=55604 RepID=UPI00146FC4E9|nr:YwaF family protein [Mycoplasmopsis primatum]
MWLFKRPLSNWYEKKETIFKIKKNKFLIIFGTTILLLMMMRSFIFLIACTYFKNEFEVTNPNHNLLVKLDNGKYKICLPLWEILPFHFCRLCLFAGAIFIITNKFIWIKNLAFLAIIAALVFFVKPNLRYIPDDLLKGYKYTSLGIDSYIYWDSLFFHMFIILLFTFVSMVEKQKLTFKNTLYFFVTALAVTLFIFFINWLSYMAFKKNDKAVSWISDYWYLSPTDDVVSGKWLKWPWTLFVFSFIGTLLLVLGLILYNAQDVLYFDKTNEGKWLFKVQKSENWCVYKNSFKQVFNKNKNLEAKIQ